jgi:glycosyltransferase involved in cell wall biosynthesis
MDRLPVSVVVIARNAEKTMRESLYSIKQSNPAEIVVVDGNSHDRTVEIARGYTDRIYSDEGRGMGYASQLGTERATQEYVAYIDSDVVIEEGALATMLNEFRSSDVVAISALQFPEKKDLNYWEWAADERGKYSKARRREAYLGMLACLFRRETILKYGFDTTERYLHDIDLEMRLRKDGHRFGISTAIAHHHHRFTFRSFVRYRFFEGKVADRYIKKWGPWHIRFWPPLYSFYWLGFCLMRGKFRLLPYVVVDGTVQTAGMVKGFFELIGDSSRRNGQKNGAC